MTILFSIITLTGIGISAAVILFFVAKKFVVHEDERIALIEEELPGVNCGACGFTGCHNFAEVCVKADSLGELFCPVGGNDCMGKIAHVLGKEVLNQDAKIAVVKCNGSPGFCPIKNNFDGPQNCKIVSNYYAGTTACQFGCLGLADCVRSCRFDAITMDEETGLPVIIEEKCTSCGACVKACPRQIIELRKIGKKNRRVFVSCVNKDPGAKARKACQVACIGCGKCAKECPVDAITIISNLAYIDFIKCIACRKCVSVCPTHAIHDINFADKKCEVLS